MIAVWSIRLPFLHSSFLPFQPVKLSARLGSVVAQLKGGE